MNNWGAWIINDKNIKIAYWEKLEVANICLFCLRFGRNNLANIKIIIFGLPAATSSSWQTLQRWLFLCNLNAELQLLLGLCVYEGAIDIGSQYSISLYDMKWGSFPVYWNTFKLLFFFRWYCSEWFYEVVYYKLVQLMAVKLLYVSCIQSCCYFAFMLKTCSPHFSKKKVDQGSITELINNLTEEQNS